MSTIQRVYLNTWTAAGKHIHLADGDFFQMTGLYPALDRQTIRRAPDFSSHLTHAGLTDVEGMFFDRANTRYVLIGQDATPDLSCTYFSSAWSAVGATYVLDAAVATMDGLSLRNYMYAHGYLWILCDTDLQQTDNYVTSAVSSFESSDAEIVAYLGDRVYMINDVGKIYRIDTAGAVMETNFNPVDEITPLYATGLKDDLVIVAAMLNGELRVMRTTAYAKTAIRKLEDMAVLPGDTTTYPAAGCPFCAHDNDLYLLSGEMANPDGTVTRDLLAYTGYRVERIARIEDASASALGCGLISWRGELIYYEFTASAATFKMLIGNNFIDFATPASYTAAPNPIAANLGGEIVFTGEEDSDEGIYHLGGSALQNGNVETAYLDGGRPGVMKRLIKLTMHVENPSSLTVKTLSYKTDDASSYTQAATATSAAEMLAATSLGVPFYRLRIKAALADTSTTRDVRIAGLSYTYAVGED
jgi:hypothetical protein